MGVLLARKSPVRVSLPRFHFRVGLHIDLFEIPWRLDSDRRSDRVRLLNPPTLETTMQVIADRPEAPTAIHTDRRAIFVSLELSRSTWLITSLSPGGREKMSKHSVRGRRYRRALETVRSAQGESASADGAGLFRRHDPGGRPGRLLDPRVLQSEEVESHVVDPASIATSRRQSTCQDR